ncbi:MAG: glycosyltransferase family 2 protein [Thermomicrobiales bacterium]
MTQATLQVSVVIPTYNRWAQLVQVLDGYRTQTLPPATFEVLVCDDASSDQTPSQVSAYAAHAPYALRLLPAARNAGPAAARNRGLHAAQAPIVVCTDDDCVPHPALLARHAAAVSPTTAAIGQIAWHPALAVSPFMAFLAPGYRFNFAQITDPHNATYRCFYTANVALWRATALTLGGFDERFRRAFEDIELGYRLHQAGVRLVYDPDALVYHLHAMRLAPMLRRQEGDGAEAAAMLLKHPALAAEAGVPRLRDPATRERFYQAAMEYYCAAGFACGRGGDFAMEVAPEQLDDPAPAWPGVVTPVERQFFAANTAALALESRLARLEAEYAALAPRTDALDRALRGANPLKNWLRQLSERFGRKSASRRSQVS